MKTSAILLISAVVQSAIAFLPTTTTPSKSAASSSSSSWTSPTALNLAEDKDFLRFTKAARQAGLEDRVVELKRPLGVVLEEDANGNVYVETVAPKGNAARTGLVKEGDVVTMCSATFGDQMWSCRGAGLSRVLAAIRVRAGPTVKLVFESSKEKSSKVRNTNKAAKAAEAARARAQSKKDELLKELEKDEKRLKKGKFLGLF